MKIRHQLFQQLYGNKPLLKAIAFAIYIKNNVVSSSVPHYTVNKLRSISGMSANAIKKRLDTLKEYGLVEYTGIDSNCLVFKRISSKSRNIDVSGVIATSPREIEKSLSAMLVVVIQNRKCYASRLTLLCHHGKTRKEVKEGQRMCRLYGYNGEYKEYGLSYAGIAKRLGVSVTTAFEIVKYAVRNQFLRKIRNCRQFFVRGIGKISSYFKDIVRNVFFTKNNYYEVSANTYIIHPRLFNMV